MGKSGLSLAMKIFVVFCFIAAAAAKPQGSTAVGYADGRIIGGEEAPAHEFPWQISLRNLGSHICGGSIINKNQVITAAHCVEGALPIKFACHHGDGEPNAKWTPFGCCSQKGCDHPQVVCRQRSISAGLGECPLYLESWLSHFQL